MFTLPVITAPDTISSIQGTAHPHLRPHLSAIQGMVRVPMTPPVWKRPFVDEMRSVALGRVSSFMYLMNEGWPAVVSVIKPVDDRTYQGSIPSVVPMMEALYP